MVELRRVGAVLFLFLTVAACSGEGQQRNPVPGPQPRKDDPRLSHTWTMPEEAGPIAKVDLGTRPESLADALMAGGKIAGVTHRIGTRCASQGVLPRPGIVVLRLSLGEGGELQNVEGDPPGPAGTCLSKALRSEAEALSSLPAGVALLRLELHPSS